MPTRKINILFLTNKLLIGGAEMVFVNQVGLIDKEKFNVFVGLLYGTNKETNLYHKLKVDDSQITCFNLKQARGVFDILGIIRVLKFLKNNKIDIIFTSLFESNFVGRLAAKLAGTKIIISSEHSCYYNKKNWQKISDWCLSFITNKIIAVTEEIVDFTSKQEKINKNKFQVLQQISDFSIEGIFSKNELRHRFGIPEQAMVFSTLGRFSPEKAQYRIIEMADHIINKLDRKDIYFIIIGYGALHQDLADKIKMHGLDKYVKIIVDPKSAKEYLTVSDAFILTSDREGMPIVLLEAMYNKLPCIAFAVGGVVDILKDGYNGFIVEAKNSDLFIDKILYLADQKEQLKIMGNNAKESAVEKAGNIKELEVLLLDLFNKK